MTLPPTLSLILALTLAIPSVAFPQSPPTTAPTPPEITVTVDRTRPLAISQFQTGVTHTHRSFDSTTHPQALARAKELLQQCATYHNQHIMGWGVDNPNPAPNVYNFASLDRRLALIESMNGTPVLTLCAAPDWMKGGRPHQTDWSKIEAAPLPEHYADFAHLAKTIALRYPKVKHYQVWNEMKGFWNPQKNNWDYENYTRLYNLVYDALKSVNKDIQVGGPYLVIEGTGSNKGTWAAEPPIRQRQWDLINYWLTHKHGADFITIDRSLKDPHDKHSYTEAELMALTPTFGQVVRQLRMRQDLPIWYAEYYGHLGSPDFIAAHYASIYHHMMFEGVSVALLWSPQGGDINHGLFTSPRTPDGAQSLPHYEVFKIFHDHFPPGTLLYNTDSSSPDLEAIASLNKILLINKRPTPLSVRINGQLIPLRPYQVLTLDRNPDGD